FHSICLYTFFFFSSSLYHPVLHSFPTRRSSDLFTSIWIYILAPVLVITQIIGGAIMSYLRVRFNFWLGFLYHALWNFIAFFIIEDRKSTRLNSSHVKISYAVFCLKKKNSYIYK